MTTKILALTDALGNLVRFELLPGQRYDTIGVEPLLSGITFGGLIADRAFDINAIIADLNQRGAKIVISQHPRRIGAFRIDRDFYKWRPSKTSSASSRSSSVSPTVSIPNTRSHTPAWHQRLKRRCTVFHLP